MSESHAFHEISDYFCSLYHMLAVAEHRDFVLLVSTLQCVLLCVHHQMQFPRFLSKLAVIGQMLPAESGQLLHSDEGLHRGGTGRWRRRRREVAHLSGCDE